MINYNITGEETKLALNSKYTGNKFSSSETVVNKYLVFFIYLLILQVTSSYVAKIVLEHWRPNHELYIGRRTEDFQQFNIRNILQDMFSFLLLYYYIIPMSLYVTIELYKFIGGYNCRIINMNIYVTTI